MPPLQLLGVSGAELALNEQIKRQVHNFFLALSIPFAQSAT